MPETMGQQITRRNYLKYLITVIATGAGIAIGYGLRELTGSPTETPTLTQTLTQTATQTATQTVTERKTETQPVTQTISQTITEKTTLTPPPTTITQTINQTVTEKKTETTTKTVTEGTTTTQTLTQTTTITRTVTAQAPAKATTYKIELRREACRAGYDEYCGACWGADPTHFEPGIDGRSQVKGGTTNGWSVGYFKDDKIELARTAAIVCPNNNITVTEV